MFPFRPRSMCLLCCTCALVVLALVLQRALNPLGAATTPDSLAYLYTAHALDAGLGLTLPATGLQDAARVPLTLWAPLYPVWLSLFLPVVGAWMPGAALPVLLTAAATLANGVALAGLSLVLQALLRRHLGGRSACLLTAVVLMSPAVLLLYTFAWSETLCLPLLLGAFLACRQRGDASPGTRRSHLPWAAVLLALAIATRYACVAFLPVLALEMLLVADPVTVIRRLRNAIGLPVLTLALLAPLWWRNLRSAGSLSGGDRIGLHVPVPDYAGHLGTSLIHYALADRPALLLLVPVVLGLGYWHARAAPAHLAARGAGRDAGWALLWACTYLIALVGLSRLQSIDGDGRMVALVVPLLLYSVVVASVRLRGRVRPMLALAPALLLVVVTLGSGLRTLLQARGDWLSAGTPGFLTGGPHSPIYNNYTANPEKVGWRLLAADLRRADADRWVVSDLPALPFRFVTGIGSREVLLVEGSPHGAAADGSKRTLGQVERWARSLAGAAAAAPGQAPVPAVTLLLTEPEQIAIFLRQAGPRHWQAQLVALDPRFGTRVLAVRLPLSAR